MQVEAGEVFGFIGPMRRQIDGHQAPDEADFPDGGGCANPREAVSDVEMHRDIGYLPEQPYFYDYLTAAKCSTISAGSRPDRCRQERSRPSAC